MTDERWRIACHEAGHAVAGIALGGRCDGVVITAAGGQAFVNGVFADRFAYMIAAGPLAEAIANQHEPPVGPVVTPAELAELRIVGVDRDLATACTFADLSALPPSAVSDDRLLALWAVGGRESEPEAWAGRVEFARYVAAEIVNKNTQAIVEIAKSLYVAGRLSGDEIQNLMGKK